MPDYGTPITIRHLLTHASGLRERWSLMALTGNGPGTQAHTTTMILDLASRQKGLNFKPGAEFLYTNTNYAMAAMVIERVSGQSLRRFTDQRLFQPLGMSHTRWREDFRTVVLGRATAYAPAGDGFIANMPLTNVYGNGGLLTTVGDLGRYPDEGLSIAVMGNNGGIDPVDMGERVARQALLATGHAELSFPRPGRSRRRKRRRPISRPTKARSAIL